MQISETYVSFESWKKKMVVDNRKMASIITVFKNWQIFMQQIKFLNEKLIFLLTTDEYILNKWAELVADGYMQNIWKLKNKPRYLYVNTTEINTEQNEGNNNEQFKILKNKVKFELFRPFLDSVKLT